MVHSFTVRLVAGVAAVVLSMGVLAPAAAQSDEPAKDSGVVTATARAHVSAAADGRPGGGVLLCITGSQVPVDRLHRLVRGHVARPWEVVVTPELDLRDDDGEDNAAEQDDVIRRIIASELIDRALSTARRQHGVDSRAPLRVLVLGDGMRMAHEWLGETTQRIHHVVLVQPKSELSGSIVPDSRQRHRHGGSEEARTIPAVDVFLTAGDSRWINSRRRSIVSTLGGWQHGATFHANLPFAGNLAQRLDTVADTLDGVRIYDAMRFKRPDEADFLDLLLDHDVVALGETHDNTAFQAYGAKLFATLIEKAQAEGRPVALSLEMFERDVQEVVDAYLAGEIDEAEFLENSRPWPNYRTGYRAFIEAARKAGVDVLAGNVPRPIAARIAREGREALDALDEEQRPHAARELHDGPGEYRDRFFAVMQQMMGQHGHGHGRGDDSDQGSDEMDEQQRAHLERMYSAQAIKDDTMAESIADWVARQREETEARPFAVHLNGRFHSDYRLGMVERLEIRDPELHTVVLTCMPVESWDAIDGDAVEVNVADFVVFAPTPRSPQRRR